MYLGLTKALRLIAASTYFLSLHVVTASVTVIVINTRIFAVRCSVLIKDEMHYHVK